MRFDSRRGSLGQGRSARHAEVAAALLVCLLAGPRAEAQGFWAFNGRTHPELDWQVLETDHFRVIFHQGLEATARETAAVAESVYDPICRQLDTWPEGKTPIVISDQDEVVNGYALPSGQIFVWVHQNDAVRRFSGTEKWVRKVVAHEFQHRVTFEALGTWAGTWNLLFVPAWLMEGLAEYYTESWGVERSDRDLRRLTLLGGLDRLDPHDSGFARVLLLAHEHGDSSLVKMVKHRNRLTGLYGFGGAFRAATGRTYPQFEETWRRTMHATYYGYLGQKEDVLAAGEAVPLPVRDVRGLAWSPDSARVAIVGRSSRGMQELGLYLASGDSLKQVREVDHGALDDRVSWSPDGRSLVYAKQRRGRHGSLVWDLRRLDVGPAEEKARPRGRWLTRDRRANDPAWSPGGGEVLFLASEGRAANLHVMDAAGGESRPLTSFAGDVQVQSPRWSPDGAWIAFSLFDETSGPDIALVRADGGGFRKLTSDTLYDFEPLWSPDGRRVYFTSYREDTANLFAVAVEESAAAGDGGGPATPPIEQLTDSGEGLWGVDMAPGEDRVIALALASVDSARVVRVAGSRRVTPQPLRLRPPFLGWTRKAPEIALGPVDRGRDVVRKGPYPYHAWQDPRWLVRTVVPYPPGYVSAFAVLGDALGRHQVTAGGAMRFDLSERSGFAGYIDASRSPFLTAGAFRRTRAGLRMYERRLLTERQDGVGARAAWPWNGGDRLDANGTLVLSADLYERVPVEAEAFVGERLPVPQRGREGLFALEARWLRRRPHRSNEVLPRQGVGLGLRAEAADAGWFGDFTYRRVTAEGFGNRRAAGGMGAWFGRVKFEALAGSPPAQVFTGVTPDENIYLSSSDLLSLLQSSFLATPETVRLRGWPHVRLGRRSLWASGEWRVPLAARLPVSVFGVQLGALTGAVFADAASVWSEGDAAASDWISTAGIELRQTVRLAGSNLFTAGGGFGQRTREWREGRTDDLEWYARLALVNPW